MMAYVTPTTIGGYPAVYAGALDQRDVGGCRLWIGISDDQVFGITATFLQAEPCPVVARTTEAMVAHLSDGASFPRPGRTW